MADSPATTDFFQNIASETPWGYLDDIRVTAAGLIELKGWAHSPVGEALRPRVIIDRDVVEAYESWRWQRPDLPHLEPLAGVAFAYLAPKLAAEHIAIDLDRSEIWSIQRPFCFEVPHYSDLMTRKDVLHRDGIYGSGPPVFSVDLDVAQLAGLLSGRVLDFGCGSGALVKMLRNRGIDARGIEIDRPEIRSSVAVELREYVTLYKGGNLPFASDHFDWATAIEVVEHIQDFREALSELRRVSPRLLMTVPDVSAIPRLYKQRVVPWHLLEATHVNFFNQSSLAVELSKFYSKIEFGRIGAFFINGSEAFTSLVAVCT